MANPTIVFSLLIFSCFALRTPATYSSNQTDLLSLLSIKAAINSDPKRVLNSWNESSTNFCSWEGIRCDRRHPDRVVAINLLSQGLSGSLSPHIGNLSFLRSINLQKNNFYGQIPQEIGRLRRLEFAELSNNSFSGIMPRNMSQCRNLVYLNLENNSLSGFIPPEVGFLYKLEVLSLSRNTLSGPIPQSIGNLTNLTNLSLAFCGLIGGIPESLARLHRLELLQLRENNLTGSIPHGLFNISTIRFFEVTSNRLEGSIPSTIGLTLPSLSILRLYRNQFSGHIPVSLSNASSLIEMRLGFNNFTGSMPRFEKLSQLKWVVVDGNSIEGDISFISTMTNCTNLQFLSLRGNRFTGLMPQTIANLSSHLQHLSILNSQVHGNIPSGIGNLVGLTALQLSNTNLEGPIPLGIGRLTNLQRLYLGGNRLTNELPSSFGNLSLLNELYLDGNNFSGVIPKGFGKLTNLLALNLSHNNFNGPIPQEILSLPSISICLDLSHNAFTGSIPVEVGSLSNLVYLDLSNNKLSGVLPNSIEKCTILQQLYLQGNYFVGQISNGLSSLMGLEDLDLSRNNFSGPIPSFFAELHLLKLNLSFNTLEGEVPTLGVFENKTAVSLEGNKELCGGIVELNLVPCDSLNSSKKHLSTLPKILIPIAGVATILCFLIFFYKKRKPKENLSSLPLFFGDQFLRLSYVDLSRATGGFSKANLVGVGRFASVYKGILEDGYTLIAVKVLNLAVKGASKSFMAECDALRDIRHRNIVKILSVCESVDFQGNDFKALVYEFKANGSLENWLHNNTEHENGDQNSQISSLGMIQRLDIAIDIAQALDYLHNGTDSTIVHGDLKPSNILLDENMTACIGDFGLAKITSNILSSSLESSTTIGIKGTVGYVPPEYGTNNSISTKGDTYSYGILLLEIFTNRRPTDDSFKDHVNLHSFVSAALPDRVMEIVDPVFQIGHRMNNTGTFENCLTSILSIGVSCSNGIQRDRMPMIRVVNELCKIKECYVAGDD